MEVAKLGNSLYITIISGIPRALWCMWDSQAKQTFPKINGLLPVALLFFPSLLRVALPRHSVTCFHETIIPHSGVFSLLSLHLHKFCFFLLFSILNLLQCPICFAFIYLPIHSFIYLFIFNLWVATFSFGFKKKCWNSFLSSTKLVFPSLVNLIPNDHATAW